MNVPANAQVRLAGNSTQSGGELRYFHTETLESGQVWKDYTIEVEVMVEGKPVVKSETIDLVAGQSLSFTFDFEQERTLVAAR